MGYELDRLMNQFGVSTPTLGYAGNNKPVDPGAYNYVAPAEGTTGPTDAEQKASWQALVSKYNSDLPNYTADQTAYNAYKQQYQDRIANTPQYLQNQYNTFSKTPSTAPTFSPASRTATSATGIGTEQMNRNIQDYFVKNPTALTSQSDQTVAKNQWGLSDRDVRNAMGSGFGQPAQNRGAFDATGSYWGNKLATPNYSPINDPVTSTPTTAPAPAGYKRVNGILFPISLTDQTPQQKADYYKTLVGQGYSDAQIQAAIPGIPAADWAYLKQLAGVTTGTTNTQQVVYGPDGTAYTSPDAAIKAGITRYTSYPPTSAPVTSAVTTTPGASILPTTNQTYVAPTSIGKYATADVVAADPALQQAAKDLRAAMNTMSPADAAAIYQQKKADFGFTDAVFNTYAPGPVYAHGGSVKTHFGDGGLNDMASQYGVEDQIPVYRSDPWGAMTQAERDARPTLDEARAKREKRESGYAVAKLQVPEQPTPSSVPMNAQGQLDLPALLAKYQPNQSAYGNEYEAARKTAASESQAFQDMIKKAIEGQADQGPSQAEKYFRLAAAFGAPTKTGGLGESLGNAAQVLGEYNKEKRTSQRAGQMQALQLGLQGQQAKMTAAKEDLNAVRQMAGEEMKDKRTITAELIKDYVASGRPQSTAGKQAMDEGLVQGTPAYQKRVAEISNMNIDRQMALINSTVAQMSVAQANLALAQNKFGLQAQQAAKLTPTEMKLKSETEDIVSGLDASLTALTQAYKLNPNTFDNSGPDIAQRKILEAAGSKDPKVLNTRLQENLLTEKALAGLKVAYGGNPTEGERAVLLSVQGIGAKSKEERKEIMLTAFSALKTKRMQQAKRLNEINQGLYRDTTPAVEGLE